MLRLHPDHIDHLDALIDRLDDQIESKLVPFAEDLRRVQTITGVGPTTAQVFIAEIGVDMTAVRPPGTWRRGAGCARATTSLPANSDRGGPTGPARGSPTTSGRPPGPRHGPGHLAGGPVLAARPADRQEEGDHRAGIQPGTYPVETGHNLWTSPDSVSRGFGTMVWHPRTITITSLRPAPV